MLIHRFLRSAWFLIVGAVTVSAAAADPPKVAQRWAVLVGVDDYAYAQKLQYCGADQRALRDQLVAAGFPEDQVFLLHDKADDPRFRPSQGNIERQLNLVLNLADAQDLVVIAFSGHGVHLDGKSYLCPGDCTLDDAKTLIGVDGIYDRLKDCAAGFKLVLVDACRNDPRPGGTRSMTATDGTRALARTLQELRLPEGVVLLNSCAPGEVSWEDEQFGHGVFMHFVLEGMNGAADTGGDGSVSLNELQTYAGQRTKTYVANRHSVAQRPFFKGDLTTEALEYALLPVHNKAQLLLAPDAAMAATAVAMSEGNYFAVWNSFPRSYQADLTAVKNDFAAKMDPELWNTFFLVNGKLARVLREKKQFVLGTALLGTLQPGQKEALAGGWDVVVGAYETLAASEIRTLDGFKRTEIGRYLETNGPRVMPQIMKIVWSSYPEIKQLAGVKYEIVSQDGDVATLREIIPGKTPTEDVYRRVEGKWILKKTADEWSDTLAGVQKTVDQLLITPEAKTNLLRTLAQINLTLDRMATATDQAAFDADITTLIVTIAPLFNQPTATPAPNK